MRKSVRKEVIGMSKKKKNPNEINLLKCKCGCPFYIEVERNYVCLNCSEGKEKRGCV
jgi:hypothetical protein